MAIRLCQKKYNKMLSCSIASRAQHSPDSFTMASYNPNPPPSTASATSSFLTIPHDILSNPILLAAQDILTVLSLSPLLPNMFYPLHPLASPLDELYPTFRNLRDLCLHIILLLSQISLLLSLPFAFITLWAIPCLVHAVFYISFGIVTSIITWILNERPKWQGNRHDSLIGRPEGSEAVNGTGTDGEGEVWFFINGIATGYLASPPTPLKWTGRIR